MTTFSPAFSRAALADFRPGVSSMPSVPPLSAVRDFTLSVKFFDDASLSMMRSCSMPPSGFFADFGTMNGSPPEAQMVPNGSLSELSRPEGAPTASLKSAGIVLAASFSTHEPFGMKSALPWVQAVCDWMWSMPGVPLRM